VYKLKSTGLGSIDEIKILTKLSVLLIKRFSNKALPVRSLYANEDGCLHLNEAGQYELRIK
jgi:hypothetical protein